MCTCNSAGAIVSVGLAPRPYVRTYKPTNQRISKQTRKEARKETYTYTCIHIRTHTHMYIYIYTYIYICYMYIFIHIRSDTYTHAHFYMHLHTYFFDHIHTDNIHAYSTYKCNHINLVFMIDMLHFSFVGFCIRDKSVGCTICIDA